MAMKFNMAIVGLGGVGGIIADNMFAFTRSKIFGWELSELVFIDRDAYTRSNIPRQKAAGRMLGRNKAVAWRDVYQASRHNRDDVSFDAIQEWVTNETVSPMFHSLRNCPLVVMACVDNHPARLVLSRWAASCSERYPFKLNTSFASSRGSVSRMMAISLSSAFRTLACSA